MARFSHLSRMLALNASGVALLVGAAAANAQEAPPPATAPDGAQAAAAEAEGLADIVVTAQRREESLQRTALAISAVGGNDLVNAGVSDVTNLSKLVPALVVQPTIGSSTNFYVRGVGSFAANAFTENPIAFNFNGVYIARPSAPLGTFYDLERVEVLKGPQGTLYGRNATGGAINVIPKRPELGRFGVDATAEYGNYDTKKFMGAVNVPLGDKAALRVAGQIVDRDAYLSDGYDDEKGQAVRASLYVEPNDWLSATIVADYFHQGGKGTGGVLVPGPLTPLAPPPSDRIGNSDPRSVAAFSAAFPTLVPPGLVIAPQQDGYVDGRFWGLAATINADLGFATLTVLPAYRESRPKFRTYNGGYRFDVEEHTNQKSLEVRLASSPGGRLGYVVGGYLFDEKQDALNDAYQGLVLDTFFTPKISNKSAAIFGQLTYSLTDSFRIVGGGRYTSEKKAQATTFRQSSFGVGATTSFSGEATFHRVTYKAGIEFDAGPRSLIYANMATGFKSGGFFIAPLDNTFAPEKLTAYTIGAKNRFIDNRLQLNIEGFYWDYQDQQVNYIGATRISATESGQGLVTTNAGRSRIYGAEAEMRFQLSRNDLFSADLQYLNGKYTSFSFTTISPTGAPPRTSCTVTPAATPVTTPPARALTVDCSGRPQINSPKWTFNAAYEHTFELPGDLKLVGGARTRIESGRFLSTEYLPEQYQKAYRSSDAYLTLSGPKDLWSITGFVNNLENRTIYAGSNLRPVAPVVFNILRPPRTYGVRLGFHY